MAAGPPPAFTMAAAPLPTPATTGRAGAGGFSLPLAGASGTPYSGASGTSLKPGTVQAASPLERTDHIQEQVNPVIKTSFMLRELPPGFPIMSAVKTMELLFIKKNDDTDPYNRQSHYVKAMMAAPRLGNALPPGFWTDEPVIDARRYSALTLNQFNYRLAKDHVEFFHRFMTNQANTRTAAGLIAKIEADGYTPRKLLSEWAFAGVVIADDEAPDNKGPFPQTSAIDQMVTAVHKGPVSAHNIWGADIRKHDKLWLVMKRVDINATHGEGAKAETAVELRPGPFPAHQTRRFIPVGKANTAAAAAAQNPAPPVKLMVPRVVPVFSRPHEGVPYDKFTFTNEDGKEEMGAAVFVGAVQWINGRGRHGIMKRTLENAMIDVGVLKTLPSIDILTNHANVVY